MESREVLLEKIGKAFEYEQNSDLKSRKTLLGGILLNILEKSEKEFGLFVIFGWEDELHRDYADVPDMTQDIFDSHEINIFDIDTLDRITSTINFDGAILINCDGKILHSGIVIEGLRPRKMAEALYPADGFIDLSMRLGFKKKVHTRHLSAIAASWELKGTTVFTISEETRDMHIFENGHIIFSTVDGEK
jgi:DNA integrity scanning protein DisA with diadenylate cyclase activity